LPVTYLHNADFSPYYVNDAEHGELRQEEVKFQLSLKASLWPNAFGSRVSAWFAFTLQSYWQLYASDVSAPFRETNYEPELFVEAPISGNLWGWQLRKVVFGINHQSNGRSEPLSRSWNRISGALLLDRDNAAISLRTWWRIPEDDAEDDNPDIEDYLGRAEIGVAYRSGQQTIAVLLKNNLRSANKSGVQIDWSFPLLTHLRGYAQLYSGYGENLIDGPNHQTRIGLGVMLTDWL
jgi:phospholipase A1